MQFFSRFASGRRTSLAARAAFALGAALFLPEQQAEAAGEVAEVGIWIDHEGKGAIEIKPCGTALCGNIVWIKNPVNDQGEPLFDRRNPDANKRNRPICGLPVIGNLRRMSDGWDEGWIYSPEEGSLYDVALKAASKDKLVVTGYKGVKLFSKTFTWTRAPVDFQKCAGLTESKAKPAVVPPKVAAPTPNSGAPAVAKKPAATNAAAHTPAGNKPPVAKTLPATANKPASKDTAAKASAAAPAKKAATTATALKPGEKAPAAKSATAATKKQPAAATAAANGPAPKKTAATNAAGAAAKPALVPPKPTAAKKPAATATASTAGDGTKKPAAKPAVKKQTAEEADASPAAAN